MSFEPQNELERSLLKAAKDPSHRPQFYRDFVESDIFIVNEGPAPGRPGPTVLNAGYELNMRPVQINGKPHLPAFSSLLRLEVFVRRQVAYFNLNTLEFMKLTN
ncbi:MAG: SseB family protein, partial [Planctomycetota bacterium]